VSGSASFAQKNLLDDDVATNQADERDTATTASSSSHGKGNSQPEYTRNDWLSTSFECAEEQALVSDVAAGSRWDLVAGEQHRGVAASETSDLSFAPFHEEALGSQLGSQGEETEQTGNTGSVASIPWGVHGMLKGRLRSVSRTLGWGSKQQTPEVFKDQRNGREL